MSDPAPAPQYSISYGRKPLWRSGCGALLVVAVFVGYVFLQQRGAPSNQATTLPAGSAPAATPLRCADPSAYPATPVPDLVSVQSNFGVSGISSIAAALTVKSDPGPTANLFLQIYTAPIDTTAQSFGIGTSGLALFTRSGTTDRSNVMAAPGSSVVVNPGAGGSVSLEHNFGALPPGAYYFLVERTSSDAQGDWFSYSVTHGGQPALLLGSVRFPRAVATVPAGFADGGLSTVEDLSNSSGAVVHAVPVWQISFSDLANGDRVPNSAVSSYSAMPDSDVSAIDAGGPVNVTVGGATPRCHAASTLWTNADVTPSASPSPTYDLFGTAIP